jgi:hypothetical protein
MAHREFDVAGTRSAYQDGTAGNNYPPYAAAVHSRRPRRTARIRRRGPEDASIPPDANAARLHRFVRGLRSWRRWTTVGQSAEGHPTAPPRRWQAFFSRPASGRPIRASHRRDDSVSREEPHASFRSGRLCPEGARQISPGQGDASGASVAVALGGASTRQVSPEGARQSMHRSVSPLQGLGTHLPPLPGAALHSAPG